MNIKEIQLFLICELVEQKAFCNYFVIFLKRRVKTEMTINGTSTTLHISQKYNNVQNAVSAMLES